MTKLSLLINLYDLDTHQVQIKLIEAAESGFEIFSKSLIRFVFLFPMCCSFLGFKRISNRFRNFAMIVECGFRKWSISDVVFRESYFAFGFLKIHKFNHNRAPIETSFIHGLGHTHNNLMLRNNIRASYLRNIRTYLVRLAHHT